MLEEQKVRHTVHYPYVLSHSVMEDFTLNLQFYLNTVDNNGDSVDTDSL